LDERLSWSNPRGVGSAIQSIANNHFATWWEFALGAGSGQSSHLMPSLEKTSDERPPEIPGTAADKDAMLFLVHE